MQMEMLCVFEMLVLDASGMFGCRKLRNLGCLMECVEQVESQVWREQPLENSAVGWNLDTPALQGKPRWRGEKLLEIHDLETLETP